MSKEKIEVYYIEYNGQMGKESTTLYVPARFAMVSHHATVVLIEERGGESLVADIDFVDDSEELKQWDRRLYSKSPFAPKVSKKCIDITTIQILEETGKSYRQQRKLFNEKNRELRKKLETILNMEANY